MPPNDIQPVVPVVMITGTAGSEAAARCVGQCAGFAWQGTATDWRSAFEKAAGGVVLVDESSFDTIEAPAEVVSMVPVVVVCQGGLAPEREEAFLTRGAQECLGAEELTPELLGRALRRGCARVGLWRETRREDAELMAGLGCALRGKLAAVGQAVASLAGTPLETAQQAWVTAIRAGVEESLPLLAGLLRLGETGSGVLLGKRVPFDLRDVLDDAMEEAAAKARAKGVSLACRVHPDLPVAQTGAVESLGATVAVLLENAVEQLPGEGEILLNVTLDEECDSRMRFAVSDTGRGFFEEELEALLRSPASAGGTGLRLAVLKRAARAMGGGVGASSLPGFGSTFWFSVPWEAQPGSEACPLLRLHGLVWNPRPTARKFLVDQLQRLGVRCRAAADGAEAAGLLGAKKATDPFHLLVVDLGLPFSRTLAEARELLARARGNGLAVVVLGSGDAPAGAEPTVWLTKPVLYRKWAEVLRSVGPQAVPLAPPVADAPAVTRQLSGRVLLVEDHPVNRMIAQHQLVKLGMQCDAVGDGFEAAAAVKVEKYDLILMDCQLPGMDGLEATREIRREEAARASGRVPILAMTAATREAERGQCLEAGMDGFLPKPVTGEELRRVLERWLLGVEPVEEPAPGAPETSPAAGQPQEEPLVDLRRLWDCADNDADELRYLVFQYFRETTLQLAKIEQAIRETDFAEMAARAHRCGGASATLGMKTLVPPLRALEHLAPGAAMSQAAGHLAEARREFARIAEFLKTNPETAVCLSPTFPTPA